MSQARWYLLGAEAYAASLIDRATSSSVAMDAASAWPDKPVAFPLDDGLMSIAVWDGSNCFNLNSLALRTESGQLIANEDGRARFALMLEMLAVQNSQGLAATLADWIDADNVPLPGGAEASSVSGANRPAGPANGLLSDISELRAVPGFTPDVLQRIRLYVCVRPSAAFNQLNINTLGPADAVLLSAVAGRGLSVAAAERLIAERPVSGWASLDDFFASSAIAGLGLSDETKALFARTSNWYVVGVRVQYRDANETSLSLVTTAGGHSRIVRRVFGAGARRGVL
jgi:general secretion pathway protein K